MRLVGSRCRRADRRPGHGSVPRLPHAAPTAIGCRSSSGRSLMRRREFIAGLGAGAAACHVVGLDQRGAIVLRQKWSRGQVEARLANMPPCLIGMEACVGAHHLSRKLQSLGHDARLMPARYVRAYRKGQRNDFHDGGAIASLPGANDRQAPRRASGADSSAPV
jgi:hypothetical protein